MVDQIIKYDTKKINGLTAGRVLTAGGCRRSTLAAIRSAFNETLAAIPGAQCYGQLAQFLDPQDTPWRDRLVRDPTSRPLWRPAARRMVELHQKCMSITDEVRAAR